MKNKNEALKIDMRNASHNDLQKLAKLLMAVSSILSRQGYTLNVRVSKTHKTLSALVN